MIYDTGFRMAGLLLNSDGYREGMSERLADLKSIFIDEIYRVGFSFWIVVL